MTSDSAATPDRGRPLALGREVWLFMPAALAVLLVLSVATLLLYRQSVAAQLDARRDEVRALARRAAAAQAAGDSERVGALEPLSAVSMTVLDSDGAVVAGDGARLTPPIPAAALAKIESPTTFGPGDPFGDRVVAVARLDSVSDPRLSPAAGRYMRIDRRIPRLAAEWRRLRVLTPLVLGVDTVLAVLVLLFLRHAFGPWRQLVRRAAEAGMGNAGKDEVALLTQTFERALHREQEDRERLAEGLARLGEMAAGVAHELRNGLAALSGYLEMVERRTDAAPHPRHLEALRQECRHLERVVEDFLAFAHPGNVRLAEVDLAELARRAATSPTWAANRIEVRDCTRGTARLTADEHLLRRALTNLLANAVEASPADGEVTVTVERTSKEWVVAVEDRGAGLPKAVRERLFQPFVTGRADGTGLGLPLAQRIAGLHNGRIEIRDRIGGGTRAALHLRAGKDG